ncbi:FmdB family zinc ribbon protein [Agromyces arachidis]|uniref:FmdB family zinc ribbon protein n=1 Tax=Agromyces arachidis TaxID=766966 RepID=UPI00405601AB
MPTYSYRCTACDDAFDVQQSFTDDSLTECPACGGRLRKLFSAVGVTFNGSGFYRTDSRAATGSSGSGSSSGAGGAAPSGPATSAPSGTGASSSGSSASSAA